MMREVGAGAGREEVGARPPHQPGERAGAIRSRRPRPQADRRVARRRSQQPDARPRPRAPAPGARTARSRSRSGRPAYAATIADARKATADAAAASAPMSGMDRKSLSFRRGTLDVHRSFRPRVRREESRADGVARHLVRRLPVRGSAVADAVAARLRTRGDPGRRDDHDAARTSSATRTRTACWRSCLWGVAFGAIYFAHPAHADRRRRHDRAARRQPLVARLRHPSARHAAHAERPGSPRPRALEFDAGHAGRRVRDLRDRPACCIFARRRRAIASARSGCGAWSASWSSSISRASFGSAASDCGRARLVGAVDVAARASGDTGSTNTACLIGMGSGLGARG